MGPLAHLLVAAAFIALLLIGVQVGVLVYVTGLGHTGATNVECVERHAAR